MLIGPLMINVRAPKSVQGHSFARIALPTAWGDVCFDGAAPSSIMSCN